jgi:simple sugar transport system permease protein
MTQKFDLRMFLLKHIVPIFFILISAVAAPLSDYTGGHMVQEVVTRLGRDTFLVLALLIPVMAGSGINFGLALGAYAAQISAIMVTEWDLGGAPGMLVAMLISMPISILLGTVCGYLMNRARGREMITSYVLGFFMLGIYQLVVLFAMGPVISVSEPKLLLSRGFGIRSGVDLPTLRGGFDEFFDRLFQVPIQIAGIKIPVLSILIVAGLCAAIIWFRKTKFGQEIRAVGQDLNVAAASGINVNRTRIISTIISTVLAGFGQLISLQNIGTMNVYNGAETVALYAAAALLVGGATVNRASVPSVIVGTGLFHLMFIVVPLAANRVFASGAIGEYVRSFVCYSAVAVALVMNSWNREREKDQARFGNRLRGKKA